MGTQLDSDSSTKTQEYKTAILQIGGLLMGRLTRVWLHNEYIFRKFPIGKQFEKCLEKVHSFADNVIMERKKNWTPGQSDVVEDEVGGKKRLAMLDVLLEAERKGEIDLEGIREEVNTFMFEFQGHDTTAMALVFGLMLLADHPEVQLQERIYEECQTILGDSDTTPTMSDLAEMKYLEAVIKETLRLYPSVPFIAREVTEDFMLGYLNEKIKFVL
uniref:SFRICE019005.2 n=1 Tax=Spodoptera frugiperda TaxID=7108 RepID=A0A2H1VHC9_SPOFR